MRTVKLIFIVALLIACINAASIKLVGVIRDQAPNRMRNEENGKRGSCGDANGGNGFTGTDFQISTDDYEDNEKNLVGFQCDNSNINTCGRLTSDTDPTPKYRYSGTSPKGNVRSPDSFYKWFHNSVQTKNVNHTITLTEDSNSIFKFESDAFFPIDGKGWKDYHYKDNNQHNFGFCMEAHTKFGYRGGETFRFFGDDDVWVYINNYLVIDLGSLHSKLSMEISLDSIANSIGIRKGNNYRLDFFHCERHTTESNFQVYTSLDFTCFKYDWCGICEGSGQSCCNEEYLAKNCDDKNKCTVASCNPENGACVQTPTTCTPSDKCHVSSCDPATGSCTEKDITCADADPCTVDSCNPRSGCTFTPRVCEPRNCFNVECVPNFGCNYTAKVCDDGNACTDNTCDAATGQCKYPTKNCNDNNPCTTDTCNTKTGCSNKGCDDGNACTDDKCVSGQGCSFTPKTCGNGEKCVDYTCSAGVCSGKPLTCTPQDKCHSVVCNNATGCVQQKLTCDDGNACTNDLCDPLRGCYTEDRTCNDGNACTTDTCDTKTGCKYTPNVDDGNMCTQDICDRNTGVTHPLISCDDNDVCTIDSCDSKTGCRHLTNTCADTDPCTTDTCDKSKPEGSQCIHTPIRDCTGCKDTAGRPITCTPPNNDACYPPVCDFVNKVCSNTTVNCDDNNKCTDDYCQGGNCLTRPTSCISSDKCQVASCNSSTGCVFTRKSCDDFNPCTRDECNPSSGECTSTPIGTFCTTCGTAACSYNDPCKPSICNAATSTCSVQEVSCSDNNPCTTDTCADKGGKAECSHSAVSCPASTNACTPNVCSIAAGGCTATPVNCSQADPCKIGSCQVDSGKPVCVTSNKDCKTTNACKPAVCLADGTCGFTEVVCNDNDPCTDDTCNDIGGVATCSGTPKKCDNDICGPMQCSPNNGTCISAPKSCDDGNDCTVDSFTCANETTICAYTPSNFCDDKDMCTNDICNTANVTTPCSHENVTCEPNRCQISRGCNSTTGCVFDPVDCSALVGDACKIATCDVRDGCILEDRVCPKAEDSGCYKPACNSSAVAGQDPCYTEQKDDWGTRVSNDGSKILCSLKYGGLGKKIAIGAGAAAGIAIGAAAAAGFIGFGGKKGYDYWKTMQNERFNGVQNNPLYDGPTGETDNPLYNRMSAQI